MSALRPAYSVSGPLGKWLYNGALPAAENGQSLAALYRHSPFTLAVFGVLVGYYVLYYAGVLQRTWPAAASGRQVASAGSEGH